MIHDGTASLKKTLQAGKKVIFLMKVCNQLVVLGTL